MNYRGLSSKRLVLTLGLVYLVSPPETGATPSAIAIRAESSNRCGGICGICAISFFCPPLIQQNIDCEDLCYPYTWSCDDCGDPDMGECPPEYNTTWWCD